VPVRITNLVKGAVTLGDPINDTLIGEEIKEYPFVEYDKLYNDQRFRKLINDGIILMVNPDPSLLPYYDSIWSGPSRFKLGTYHFWVDSGGLFRIKNGDASFDTDGFIVGPGGSPSPHGSSHVFNGSDPVPNIEVLENLWTCASVVVVRNVVYQSGSGACTQARADAVATMPAIGLCISKPTATTCIIARSGEVDGFAGLTPDSLYYVSDTLAGGITATAPSGSGNVVQKVGYAKSSSILVVELGKAAKKA
jgi:hypothetical protein